MLCPGMMSMMRSSAWNRGCRDVLQTPHVTPDIPHSRSDKSCDPAESPYAMSDTPRACQVAHDALDVQSNARSDMSRGSRALQREAGTLHTRYRRYVYTDM